MNHHDGTEVDVLAVVGAVVAVLAVLGYAALVVRARDRGRAWPVARSVVWVVGCLLAVAAVTGPLRHAAMTSWTAHMAGHVLLGMLAPLLLVLGAPVTLLLRALAAASGRRLVRLLRSRPLRVLTEPAVAALLDVGGLWLVYGTPLLGLAHVYPALEVLVHAHVLLAGYLFTAVLVGPDPLPHRRGTRHLLVVLVLALAAHDVLAKRLYALAGGPDLLDEQRGALVMYYGGDAVDLALAVLVCARWYRRTRPRGVGSGQRQLDLERPRTRPEGVLG
ncbi:cytochrome c oxidase assembly protein [Microlunatus spumicola]|uniref:Cytochrome c oxidase assembly protein n=1 Tax=Microlunatus spumicola TaxID=81499 RepID=A0ABP6XY57_9ACTN